MDSNSSSSSNSFLEDSNEYCPVKLLSATASWLDTTYIVNEIAEIKEVNQSYNVFIHYFTVMKDLPSDTKAVMKLYGSTSENGPYEAIGEGWSISLADTNHKYYKYLPRWLIEATKATKQVLKGRYGSDNFGFFKFYKLLSDEELNYPYFKMIYNFEAPNLIIFSCVFMFQKL